MTDTEERPMQWLVWSNEHDAWWGPGRFGYTALRSEAGRYTFTEALEIVEDANYFIRGDRPFESLVPDSRASREQTAFPARTAVLAAHRQRLVCGAAIGRLVDAAQALPADHAVRAAIVSLKDAWRNYQAMLRAAGLKAER